jgi:RNA polymerase sigma-70 factor, ECF subfamily
MARASRVIEMSRQQRRRRTHIAGVPSSLIDDAKNGDQDAFAAIHRTYEPGLRRYLETVSPGFAADVGSATWESVAGSLDRFSGDGEQFRRWLFTIARRRLVDEVRRSSRRPLAVAEVPHEPRLDAHLVDDGPDWAVALLRQISSRQADVVGLRVLGGLSVDEVADLLGITPENVRVLSHRGLNALRALIEQHDLPGIEESDRQEILSVV